MLQNKIVAKKRSEILLNLLFTTWQLACQVVMVKWMLAFIIYLGTLRSSANTQMARDSSARDPDW